MGRAGILEGGLRALRGASLKTYKVDFIDFDDRPDTATRVAKQCLERPDFLTVLPDMPRLSDEPKRQFLAAVKS